MPSSNSRTALARTTAAVADRLSFANVVAVSALFVALGGASYAAVALPRDSVGTRQLRDDSVTYSKLHARSVDTAQLRDDAVDASKIADDAVRKHSLSPWIQDQLAQRADQGPAGPRGDTGDTGPRGPGAVAVRYSQAASATSNPVTVLDTGGLSLNASCDDDGGTVTLNFSPRSTEAATLYETVTVDSGPDLNNPGDAFTGNLQIDLPAGSTSQTGGPSTASGYTRVAVEAVYSAPESTLDLHMFALVNADVGRCSINGVAVPA